MKPKPKSPVAWYADYRVRYDYGDATLGTWQKAYREESEPWQPIDYADVPDEIWSLNFRRDGWKFYTTRTHGTYNRRYFTTDTANTIPTEVTP